MTTKAALRAATAGFCLVTAGGFLTANNVRSEPAKDAGAKPVQTATQTTGEQGAPPATDATPVTAPPSTSVPSPAAAPAASPETQPQPTAPATTAVPPAPSADPVIDAVRRLLADKSFSGKPDAEDVAALSAFYGARSEAIWIKHGAFNDKAKALVAELKKAEDWGLDPAAYAVPDLSSGAAAGVSGEAEAKLSLAAMRYARHARGGRVSPLALSNILDMKPPVKEAKEVIAELSAAAEPDAYIRGLHPKHPQFEALRQALIKARGPAAPEAPIDEALTVKLPDGKTLKKGAEHDDVALLRKRLKIETPENANARMFDDKVEEAVKAYQTANDLKVNGQLTAKMRSALNREGEPKKADPKRDIDQLIVNMERWRWLPADLGPFYVINNIPEFVSRTMKGNDEVLKQKIIVGLPSWPTPVLTSSMEFVIFHPEWGVPDGIKMKELLPRLKRASNQGGGFFDQLFGGGSSGGARVLAAYKLKPSINGRPVNADNIDWGKVDIRQFSFVQPAGGENPLGMVKFRFPNRHDVYMHDTPQKSLFAKSFRALSHGCLRVEQPRKLAEVLLAEDSGMSAEKVGSLWSGGGHVTLSKPVPVYLTYFTARVDESGKVIRYGDIYGHDSRVGQALIGRAIRNVAPTPNVEDVVASTEDDGSEPPPTTKKSNKKQQQAAKKKKPGTETAGDILNNALSGLLAN